MANNTFKGIDVRATNSALIFRALLLYGSGAKVTTGTTNLYLYEMQSDGTLKGYDWNDNTFKTTALTTEVATMTHQTSNNSTTNTALWTKALSTITGFSHGGVYVAEVNNANASAPWQAREFQFGSDQGDLGCFTSFVVGASSSTNVIKTNRTEADSFWNNQVIAMTSGTYKGCSAKISSYANTNGAFTIGTAFPGTVSSGDTGIIVGCQN